MMGCFINGYGRGARSLGRVLLVASLVAACGDREGEGSRPGASSSAPPGPRIEASAAVPGPGRPSSAPSGLPSEDETSTRPVELLGLVVASGVKNKEPTEPLSHAVVGQKVYAHLTIRNRTGRTREVTLTFTVDGAERARVPLEIGESWSWRSWGYATMRPGDAGKKLTIELVDDEGHPLAERTLDVRAK